MGGAGDAFVFLVDNALGAVLGVVWGFVVPMYADSDKTAYVSAIISDALGTSVMVVVTYYLVDRFSSQREHICDEPWRPDKLMHAFHTEIHVMLVAGQTMAISSLHVSVADATWYLIAYKMTRGASIDGTCQHGYVMAQIAAETVLVLVVVVLYVGLSFAAYQMKARATKKAWATVWDLLSLSFSYAMAWCTYNALGAILTCLPGQLEHHVSTQLVRAAILCSVALYVCFYPLPRLRESEPPPRHTELLLELGYDAAYTLFALSLFDLYYQPITRFIEAELTSKFVAYTVAATLSLLMYVVVYTGVLDAVEDDTPKGCPSEAGVREGLAVDSHVQAQHATSAAGITTRRWLELVYNVGGLLVLFSWWYPLEDSLEKLYLGHGVLSVNKAPLATLASTITTAVVVTAVVAALVTVLSAIGPGRAVVLSSRPSWAKPFLENDGHLQSSISGSVSATRTADQAVGEQTHLLPSHLPQAAGGSLQTVDGGAIV